MPQRASRNLRIAAGEIAPVRELVRRLPDAGGLEAAPALATLEDPSGSISLADCFRLFHALARGVGEETFALSARPMVAGTAELVFSRAGGAASVGEAMRAIAHAYNVLHGDAYNRVEPHGRRLAYVLDDEGFPYTRPRDGFLHFSLECALIFLHGALCELADRDLTPFVRGVTTRRAEDAGDLHGALALWDAPVTFAGRFYAIDYDAAVASVPLSGARRAMAPDLAVHNRIISLIEAREAAPAEQAVLARVRRAFADGLRDQAAIASRLALSTATLRRRLEAEGSSFREALREAQQEEAIRRLRAGAGVTETAEALGFADVRSFTRAFKAWTGATPSAFIKADRTPT